MGLAERRAAKEFETTMFPNWKKKIVEAAHFEVPINVDWEALAEPDYAHLYAECWPQVYFEPLVGALPAICVDDMGREALQTGLKKIVVTNRSDRSYGSECATFEAGVLTVDHKPCTNVGQIEERTKSIQKALEAAL